MADADPPKGLFGGLSLPAPRSAVLSSLLWLIGILTAGVAAAAKLEAPDLVVGLLGFLDAFAVIQFSVTYNHLLLKRPDALGTTDADISMLKAKAELGLLGDAGTGLSKVDSGPPERDVTPEDSRHD